MKYYYCEFLGFGNPLKFEMTKEQAIKRWQDKIEGLSQYSGLAIDMSFVGVQQENDDGSNEWILKNTE